MEELIGKSVIGFNFDETEPPGFSSYMSAYVNLVGEITDINYDYKTVGVTFPDGGHWWYPLDQVKKHLVEEGPKPIISQKVYTPLEKLMNYLIQNQYYIGDGLLAEYKSLKEEEKELFFTIACRGIYGMSSESDAKKFIDEKFQ